MTPRQAEYHARRTALKAFAFSMRDRHGPGRNIDRQDHALLSGEIAFVRTLRSHGFSVATHNIYEHDWMDWESGYQFSEPDYHRGRLCVQEVA